MLRSKKVFTDGLNQDDSLHFLGESQYLRLMNARIGSTQYGKNYRIENTPGTSSIAQSVYPPYGTNITIGSCVDIEGQRILSFVYNTFNDHGIYCFDLKSNTTYAVIYDSQIESGLNFNKNFRIDKNCRVINGVLYWTDNYNEPKKINIDRGIKANHASYVTDYAAYSLPLTYEMMTVIKRPPSYCPSFVKGYNSSYPVNNTANQAFQYSYRYIFDDGETSVQSPYSLTDNYNLSSENYNYAHISMSFAEKIQSDVQYVQLLVKYLNTNELMVVKTWDKNITSERNEILNHNNGTIALSYSFYNDVAGEIIDSNYANKPYELVPLLTKTLEIGGSRLFMATNTLGYDSPSETSMTLESISAPVGTDITGVWWKIQYIQDGTGNLKTRYFIYLTGISTPGYYFYTSAPPPFPSTIAFSSLTFQSADIDLDLIDNDGTITYSEPTGDTSTVTGASPLVVTGKPLFKTNTVYQSGVVFYDRYRRKCGYVTNDASKVKISPRSYSSLNQIANLKWTLSNTNALTEIPDFAYYYQPVLSNNLTTSYFIQARAKALKYVKKAADTGEYTYVSTYSNDVYALAVDSSLLLNYSIGYTYTEGDLATLYIEGDSNVYNFSVIGQDGTYIFLSARNLSDVSILNALFEIYTPIKVSSNTSLFEVGSIYPITDASLPTRSYSTVSGLFSPDCYALSRLAADLTNTYLVEAMSPNDKYYKIWNTNAGFPNYFTLLGQTTDGHQIRFSNIFTPGTQNNGLSTFEALNFKTVPQGMGIIQKLQLASKTTEQGVIMLAIGSFQTASCYLGEVQVVGASQNAFLAQDTSVIGTINVLKGMLGTTAPETVVEYLGTIYWYDLNNGQIAQYSSNGIFPISSIKMERLFKNYAKGYLAANANNLDNINGFHHLPSFIDPFHKEFGITLPGLIYENYANTLPSYPTVPSYATSIINRFEMSDDLAKTVTYSLQENKWIGDFQFIAEQYDYFENRMFGWKNGALYEFNSNSSTWNTWFGTQYPVRVCWVVNNPLSGIKDMAEIVLEGSKAPDFTVVYTTLPNTQITDLVASDYVNQEGILYAKILRDRLSPSVSGSAENKLNFGDVVLSQIPQIMVEFKVYDSLFYINFVDVGFNLSRGQNFILGNK